MGRQRIGEDAFAAVDPVQRYRQSCQQFGQCMADMAAAKVWMVRYNAALAESPAVRRALLREQLGAVGEGAVIRPPFHCDYGYNIRLGQGVFLNYNCVILDVAEVHIGDGTHGA